MYLKIQNGIPVEYSIEKLRYDNSNISFPMNISDEILEKFDVFSYVIEDKPIIDQKTQKITIGEFIKNESGNWIRTWNILQKSQEEIISWITGKEEEVRLKRNRLLNETDYLALADNTITPEMVLYRQALRDITLQDGFPENVIWPVKPV